MIQLMKKLMNNNNQQSRSSREMPVKGMIIALACIFFLPIARLGAQDTTKVQYSAPKIPWAAYKSYEGKFTVMTPGGEMKEKQDTAKTPMGAIAYHLFFNQPEFRGAENFFYMVSYCDYPPGSVHSDSTSMVEELFKETIKEAAFSINGDVIYQDDANFLGYPGKLWRIDYGRGKVTIKTRAYFVRNRFYTVQTVMPKTMALNPSSERFLESFRLL
jgi:hypothetical protein